MDAKLLRRMSAEEINAMPLCHYEGPVRLVRTAQELAEALTDIRTQEVLGFDTETRPTFRKGKVNDPSLVQIATETMANLRTRSPLR